MLRVLAAQPDSCLISCGVKVQSGLAHRSWDIFAADGRYVDFLVLPVVLSGVSAQHISCAMETCLTQMCSKIGDRAWRHCVEGCESTGWAGCYATRA